MSDSWQPPEPSAAASPNWAPPQGPPAETWPPPYQQQGHGWPPRDANGMPHKTVDDKLLEWAVPINRSGLAIVAGYVSLVSIPLLFAAPIGIVLGILALGDLRRNPQKLGKGRAWFAVVYGAIGTALLAWFLTALASG